MIQLRLSLTHVGEKVAEESQSVLYDAQGNVMEGAGERKVEIVLEGKTLGEFGEHLSTTGPVSNPILCYGRLLENDWGIEKVDGEPFLKHASGIQVPLHYKGRSLAISGKVRQIEQVEVKHSVRAIQIDVPPVQFISSALGCSSVDEFRVCHTMQKTVVNPHDDELARTFQYRTTLMKFDAGWRVHELCEDWRHVDHERAAQTLSWKYRECVTIMSRESLSLSALGLSSDADVFPGTSSSSTNDARADLNVSDMNDAPQEISGQQVPSEAEVQDLFEFGREQGVPSELQEHGNLDIQYHVVDVPVRLEEVQEDGSFLIEGVTVTCDSTCKVLRAACKCLGLSQSGGKARLFGMTLIRKG